MFSATRTFLFVFLGVALGVAVGLGGFTFVYAKGASYLQDDPAACANCHIMNEQYDGWRKSSHHAVATCNDCHTPPGLIPKYATKASNGFWHSYYFTTGTFPDPIRLRPGNRAVTERACRKCHGEIVEAIETPPAGHAQVAPGEALQCLTCHNSVGHPEGSGNPALIRQEISR
ncbi:putative cytochrome c nitrite reductase small subunit NrfH [Myxococcus stipitatus DSM 14675]|uniref:Putative cytochrome c nitrite reductase small subunit NrfH n=1 Tax=Myxococcus stipitatus (strain DSM 14675 / JCM 12634 / Mx s8) TaxID=1278073 RepID=L7UGB9_MYXSD|nr:cytochrome c nitrite reductase small subunit [Myxococcus stipitatus]AGC47078.1 putative cytochrome c nitrite reductase small subunit NrfH [Myxococcus stipitatus DSM 14675]